jgi:hypothetical protein
MKKKRPAVRAFVFHRGGSMFRVFACFVLLALLLPAALHASRADLRQALDEVLARYPDLAAGVHPTDYRSLDDRIAARELVNRTAMATLGQHFTESYRRSVEEILSQGAVLIGDGQPEFSPIHAAFRRCLSRMGYPESKVRLYLFGSLEIECFSWGLPPERGDGIVGISSRIVRLVLDGDEGLKMSEAELEFLFHRELAHLQAGHGIFQMLTLFARSVEHKLNEEARRALHRLYRSFGLGGIVLTLADGVTKPIQKYLVSLAFRRYYVWDVNAAVSANRAALLALASARTPEEALEAGTRTLLLAMLKDYRMARRVNVPAFLAQVAAQTNLDDMVRNPDRLSVDAALSQGGADVAVNGLGDKILEILRKLLGMSSPSFPIRTAGYVEMVSDLARWRRSRELADTVGCVASANLVDRALLVLRRMSDLDDLSHIREWQLFPGASAADEELHKAKKRLTQALADHLVWDLEVHGNDYEASRLAQLATGLLERSYQYQIVTHRTLEAVAATPGLPAGARSPLSRALIESRFDNLLETALFREDLAQYLKAIEAPAQIYLDYTGYFEKRRDKLVASTASELAAPAWTNELLTWLGRHHSPHRPACQKKAFGLLTAKLAAELKASGQLAMSVAVEQFATEHGLSGGQLAD